jgi:hypothetical protein
LADRLGIAQKDFANIKSKAPDLRLLIIETALGRIPADKTGASDAEKKILKRHDRCWFKSFDGGRELAQKMFDLRAWLKLKEQILPFINAVRKVEGLPEVAHLP